MLFEITFLQMYTRNNLFRVYPLPALDGNGALVTLMIFGDC